MLFLCSKKGVNSCLGVRYVCGCGLTQVWCSLCCLSMGCHRHNWRRIQCSLRPLYVSGVFSNYCRNISARVFEIVDPMEIPFLGGKCYN